MNNITRKELFDAQQKVAHATFNLKNVEHILERGLPDNFIIEGRNMRIDKADIIEFINNSLNYLYPACEILRKEFENK